MKKTALLCIAAVAVLSAAEFEFGHGTFKMKGGFLGLTSEKSADVTSYSLVEQHKNLFSTTWFYKYEITWYDSKDIVNSQKTISDYTLNGFAASELTTPITDYDYEGLDVNIVVGKDVVKKDASHIGVGVLAGISLPYINTGKDSDDNDDTTSAIFAAMKKSKTKIKTFKLGVNINAKHSFNKFVSVYANASYAYQTGNIKNDYADADYDVDGTFEQYEAALRFTPFSAKKKVLFFTLNPELYFTLGYRYSYWKLKDVAIDITGNGIDFDKTDLDMKTSVVYAGVGYSF